MPHKTQEKIEGKTITVFGGAGFLGRHLIGRLARHGAQVRVAVPDPEAALFLKPLGDIGQIVAVPCDISRPDTVEAALSGADGAINLVGILFEKGKRTFDAVHVSGARHIADAVVRMGVDQLVHISALGADETSASNYARTKALGEQQVLDIVPTATVLRPSVVFGPEDGFLNLFAGLAMVSPVLPVFGCPVIPNITFGADPLIKVDFYGRGGPHFQPVYVGDVTDAIITALENKSAEGKTFEVAGPHVYSFKALMELVMETTGRKKILMPVAFAVAKVAAFFLEWLPHPLLTRDQVTLLKSDNVASGTLPGLEALGISPSSLGALAPTYLGRFRPPSAQRARA